MAAPSPWPVIHSEREALVADLEPLTEAQWLTQSLCADWTVRDVLGHMTATAQMTPGRFVGALIGSGFRFNTLTARGVAEEVQGTPADTLARFKVQLGATTHPPGPIDAMLGEAILHSEDIRRPLGITRQYPIDAVVRVADFYKGSNLLIGAKRRIAGLTLRATDTDWSTGSGPVVSGPAISLVLAMTGRRAALADLSGEGLETLSGRA